MSAWEASVEASNQTVMRRRFDDDGEERFDDDDFDFEDEDDDFDDEEGDGVDDDDEDDDEDEDEEDAREGLLFEDDDEGR